MFHRVRDIVIHKKKEKRQINSYPKVAGDELRTSGGT